MTDRSTSAAADTFLNRLAQLAPADLGRLRRGAGKSLSESRGVLGLFYGLLPPGVGARQEDPYFLVATLFPLVTHRPNGADLGQSLRRIRAAANQQGLDRRVERLLDSDREQLPFRLRQALHYLGSQQGTVDMGVLLDDLLAWERRTRPVQRRWAASYFAGRAAVDEPGATPPVTRS